MDKLRRKGTLPSNCFFDITPEGDFLPPALLAGERVVPRDIGQKILTVTDELSVMDARQTDHLLSRLADGAWVDTTLCRID